MFRSLGSQILCYQKNTKNSWNTYIGRYMVVATSQNNELYLRFVKGWVARNEGHLVNWAKATTTITQEKARQMTSSSLSRGLDDTSNFNDGFRQPSCVGISFQFDYPTILDFNISALEGSILTRKPPIMEDIKEAKKLLDFKHDLQKIVKANLKQLEEKRQKLQK
jgi:hypothetical protein